MSVDGGGAVLVGLALRLDEDAAVATGRDADLDVGVVRRRGRSSRTARGASARRSALKRTYAMPRPTRPKRRRRRAAWPPCTSRTWVANRPPTPNIETNDSSSGISDTPPTSKSKTAPRMSSSRTVISSRPPPTSGADDEDEVLDRDVDHRRRGLPRPARARREDRIATRGPARVGRAASVGRAEQHRQPALERSDVRRLRRRPGGRPSRARRAGSAGASCASVNGDLARRRRGRSRAPAARRSAGGR